MTEKVRYQTEDAVAIVTITRPEVRNAMDMDVFAGLARAGGRAAADPSVRAVVVTGDGGTFSSGIDTSVFTSGGSAPGNLDIATLQHAFTIYEEMAKPTIAAIAGPAFGAGFQLALACDLRVVGDDASLSVMEVRWGIIPDLGATHRLPRLVGTGRAKELCFTARRIDAEEALAIGFANRIVPADKAAQAALDWARELAGAPPLALAAIKRLVNGAFDEPVTTGLAREASSQRRILASWDFIEAVTARLEKRQPQFENR
ncbi:MAG: enoyl-CoA hydratase/isomerase family protein [Actinomycetota bacterium]